MCNIKVCNLAGIWLFSFKGCLHYCIASLSFYKIVCCSYELRYYYYNTPSLWLGCLEAEAEMVTLTYVSFGWGGMGGGYVWTGQRKLLCKDVVQLQTSLHSSSWHE